jgi:hypothetical protein
MIGIASLHPSYALGVDLDDPRLSMGVRSVVNTADHLSFSSKSPGGGYKILVCFCLSHPARVTGFGMRLR